MEDLFRSWDESDRDLPAVAAFHARFEHIHPFQDGNGRIGRFLMLKQSIECGLDLVVVDEEFEQPYKAWLEVAQSQGDLRYLVETLESCQKRFDEKMRARGIDRLLP